MSIVEVEKEAKGRAKEKVTEEIIVVVVAAEAAATEMLGLVKPIDSTASNRMLRTTAESMKS